MKSKIVYQRFRNFAPKKLKGAITRSLFALKIKPLVSPNPSPFQIGKVVFSADFEMAWAFRYSKKMKSIAIEQGMQERKNIPQLISLFDEYEIPVTWATVGHLFLEQCARVGGLAHSNLPRPDYFENRNWKFSNGDWYDDDPCTDYRSAPAWYAPDLIDSIQQSRINHEIGCHTFSHIDFSYEKCTPELAHMELEMCRKLAFARNIKLESMVFPGGTAGNYETLKKMDFITYRRPTEFDIDLPYIDNFGLVAIPSSVGLDRSEYNWKSDIYVSIINSYLKQAIVHNKICHFWFHPSMNAWYLTNVMPFILEKVVQHIKEGKLELLTMGNLAKKVLDDDKFPY
jgi:hypothetical protein